MPQLKPRAETSKTETDHSSLEVDISTETVDTTNSNNNSLSARKMRNKPQPQIIENMKEYLDNSTLNQLTTTTLRYWLKERSTHCTTREKKDILIEKVHKYYEDNMPQVGKKSRISTNGTENSPLEIDTSIKAMDTTNENVNVSPTKKIRNKPQPQIIENMKEYLDNDTLNQLTTTTLRFWLKERSIYCTTREKKDNLIEKVQRYFLENSA